MSIQINDAILGTSENQVTYFCTSNDTGDLKKAFVIKELAQGTKMTYVNGICKYIEPQNGFSWKGH